MQKKFNPRKKNKPLLIGLMSGTSMDAIDAALVQFQPSHTIKLIDTVSTKMPCALKKTMTQLSSQKIHIDLLGKTDTQLGHLFADTVLKLLKKTGAHATQITAIGSHGQTLFHQPNHRYPFTLQIADPNIIAAKTGITTVADFRRRDIALRGQGAPLTPAFHAYLFQNNHQDQCVLNIGGIANLTWLPKNKSVIGFDVGPGNTLLDQWCFLHCKKSMDKNGAWAKQGKVNNALLRFLLEDTYFKKPFPKSTGREYFNLNWLNKKIKLFSKKISAMDVQATLVEFTAASIAHALTKLNASSVWVCGGGAKNIYLMSRLQTLCPQHKIQSTAVIGIDPQWIEAMAFAWLAKQTLENQPGNLPSVTGATQKAILGAIYHA